MINVGIIGYDEVKKRFSGIPGAFDAALKSYDFLNPTGAMLVSAGKKRIDEGLKPDLNPKYKKQKTAKGYSSKPLVRTIGRRSINHFIVGGELWIGMAYHMGVHHFGYKGAVKIPAHKRKNKSRDKKSKRKKVAGVETNVKAHTRFMNIPARPYLGILKDTERSELTGFLIRAVEKRV